MEHRTSNVYAVILVGGKGKRLRPLSTDARPKAFLSVSKDRKTMFKVTLERIKRIIPEKNILVCANKAHLRLVKKDFPAIDRENLILEPASRNTAPAIGVAANLLIKRAPDAVMVILPADQCILDEQKYLDAIKAGIEFAENNDALVVLALRPTFPSTEFGYVEVSKKEKGKRKKYKLKVKSNDIYKVARFTEKPDLKTAKKFLKGGRYFWNAGAFIFRASVILNAIEKFALKIYDCVQNSNLINKRYKQMPDISIDYAVMEKADNIYCVKGSYGWQDIGSFAALKKVLKREGRKFAEKNNRITHIF